MARTIEELLDVFLDYAIQHNDFPPVKLADAPILGQRVIGVTGLYPDPNVDRLNAVIEYNSSEGVQIITPNYSTILLGFLTSSLLDADEKNLFQSFIGNVNGLTAEEQRSLIDTYVIGPLFAKKNIDAHRVYVCIPPVGSTSTVYTEMLDLTRN